MEILSDISTPKRGEGVVFPEMFDLRVQPPSSLPAPALMWCFALSVLVQACLFRRACSGVLVQVFLFRRACSGVLVQACLFPS